MVKVSRSLRWEIMRNKILSRAQPASAGASMSAEQLVIPPHTRDPDVVHTVSHQDRG